jgi:hypothetical protein
MRDRKKNAIPFLATVFLLATVLACGQGATSPTATGPPAQSTEEETPVQPSAVPQAADTPVPTDTPEPMGITVTGEITNLEEAIDHLADDSYLQLVFLPPDGQLGGRTDEKGRVFYTSELSRIPIPSDGVFAFGAESLDPGSYLIAAQLLNNSFGMTPLLVKDEEYVTAEIRQNAELPLTIDVGEVTIPLPGP